MPHIKMIMTVFGAIVTVATAAMSWGVIKEKVDSNEASIAAVDLVVTHNTEKLQKVELMTKFIYKKMLD